jgi:hypothetical protein
LQSVSYGKEIDGAAEIDKPSTIGAHLAGAGEPEMLLRSLFVVLLGLAVSSCGIKSDLLMPDGKATPKSQKDPSRPPQPIGK